MKRLQSLLLSILTPDDPLLWAVCAVIVGWSTSFSMVMIPAQDSRGPFEWLLFGGDGLSGVYAAITWLCVIVFVLNWPRFLIDYFTTPCRCRLR